MKTHRTLGVLLVGILASCSESTPQIASPELTVPEVDLGDTEPWVTTAVEEARTKLQEDLQSAEAWGNLGMVLHAHRFNSAAQQAYLQANELDSKDYRWVYFLALAKDAEGSDDALEALRAATQERPQYMPARLALAKALLRWGEYDEAKPHLQKVFKPADPNYSRAGLGLAQIAEAEGNLEEAIDLLDKSRAKNPKHAEVHSVLAGLYHKVGRTEEAQETQKKAKTLRSGSAAFDPLYREVVQKTVTSSVLTARARQLYESGQKQQAADLWRKILERNPAHLTALQPLGKLLEDQDQPEEALKLWKAASEAQPDHIPSLVHLARLHAATGNVVEAVAIIQKAVLLDPSARRVVGRVTALSAGQFRRLFYQLASESGARQGKTLAESILAEEAEHQGAREMLTWLQATSTDPEVANPEKAEQDALQATQSWGKESTPSWLNLAHALRALEKSVEARQAAEQAVALARETKVPILIKRAETLMRQLDESSSGGE